MVIYNMYRYIYIYIHPCTLDWMLWCGYGHKPVIHWAVCVQYMRSTKSHNSNKEYTSNALTCVNLQRPSCTSWT